MPAASRIVSLKLEDVVQTGLAEKRTRDAIVVMLNAELDARRKDGAKRQKPISAAALDRYLRTLSADVAAAGHRPELAERNAGLAINFEQRFQGALKRLDEMLDAYDKLVATLDQRADEDGVPMSPVKRAELLTVFTAGQVPVLKEHREHLKLYADLMERIHNAKQIQIFQQAVLDAVTDADADVARKVEEKLRQHATARRAALLGISST